MKQSKRFLEIAMISFCGLILSSCQKENPLSENEMIFSTDAETGINSLQINSSSVSGYLLNMVGIIETMAGEGLLNEGNATSLRVKIENAIKSIDKGNTDAFKGQLNAFINEIWAFINKDSSTIVGPGITLIKKAKNAIILADGSFVDSRDGYEYPVVLIGDQLWMAENLRATKYIDGTEIQLVENPTEWRNLTTGGYCWFGNNYDIFGTKYGALYNWYAVNTENLCPEGWHVPFLFEWMTLTETLGDEGVAGGKLKATGTIEGGDGLWRSPNTGATNESGFTALPGGSRTPSGVYYSVGVYTNWWSSNPMNDLASYTLFVGFNTSRAMRGAYANNHGLSVRCVRE